LNWGRGRRNVAPHVAVGHSNNYAHVAAVSSIVWFLAQIKVPVPRKKERQRQRRQIAESYSLSCCRTSSNSCCQSPQQQQQLQQQWIIRIPAFSPVAKACAA